MDCIIIGAGGHGKVVLDVLRAAGTHRAAGFLDANTRLAGQSIHGVEVIGAINLLPRMRAQKIRGAIVAVGDNRVRARYAAMILDAGLELISAIHPSAIVSPTAIIGRNVVIAAGAMICTDAQLADSTIANTGCVIDHECIVEAGAHICPAAALAGRVRVGSLAFVGLGARVLPCLTVGAAAVIGAGATVIDDVAPGAMVVGTPARPIQRAA